MAPNFPAPGGPPSGQLIPSGQQGLECTQDNIVYKAALRYECPGFVKYEEKSKKYSKPAK